MKKALVLAIIFLASLVPLVLAATDSYNFTLIVDRTKPTCEIKPPPKFQGLGSDFNWYFVKTNKADPHNYPDYFNVRINAKDNMGISEVSVFPRGQPDKEIVLLLSKEEIAEKTFEIMQKTHSPFIVSYIMALLYLSSSREPSLNIWDLKGTIDEKELTCHVCDYAGNCNEDETKDKVVLKKVYSTDCKEEFKKGSCSSNPISGCWSTWSGDFSSGKLMGIKEAPVKRVKVEIHGCGLSSNKVDILLKTKDSNYVKIGRLSGIPCTGSKTQIFDIPKTYKGVLFTGFKITSVGSASIDKSGCNHVYIYYDIPGCEGSEVGASSGSGSESTIDAIDSTLKSGLSVVESVESEKLKVYKKIERTRKRLYTIGSGIIKIGVSITAYYIKEAGDNLKSIIVSPPTTVHYHK